MNKDTKQFGNDIDVLTKDTKESWEKALDDALLKQIYVNNISEAEARFLQRIFDTMKPYILNLLAKERQDLKEQVMEDDGPSIGQIDQWQKKYDLLTSRGSKLVHLRNLLIMFRTRIEAIFETGGEK